MSVQGVPRPQAQAPTAMKAITLRQPWASLIAHGHKRYETRHWHTPYRGPIAVHAARRPLGDDEEFVLGLLMGEFEVSLPEPLPFGAVVAVADLVACERMTTRLIDAQARLELLTGNWQVGRYAWRLENVQRLDPPVPAKGEQGLWLWRPA